MPRRPGMNALYILHHCLVVFGVLFAAAYFIKSNSSDISYETETALITSIEKKTVATEKRSRRCREVKPLT